MKLLVILLMTLLFGCSSFPKPDMGLRNNLIDVRNSGSITSGTITVKTRIYMPDHSLYRARDVGKHVKRVNETLKLLDDRLNLIDGAWSILKIRRRSQHHMDRSTKYSAIFTSDIDVNFYEDSSVFAHKLAFGSVSHKTPEYVKKNNGIIMLTEDITFVDIDNRKWVAKKGTLSDGASIPIIFQTLYGDPMDEKLFIPAILHDYWCDKRNLINNPDRVKFTSREVNIMFYQALRHFGVDEQKAIEMFVAVELGGPSWSWDDESMYIRFQEDIPFQKR